MVLALQNFYKDVGTMIRQLGRSLFCPLPTTQKQAASTFLSLIQEKALLLLGELHLL